MKMPVFGVDRDQKIGTYLLRPSSAADPTPNTQLLKANRKTDYAPSLWKRSCRLARSTERGENSDPNVLIAAYGTQVTLYRDANDRDDPKKCARAKSTSYRNRSPIDVHVPTDNTAIRNQSAHLLFNKARGIESNKDKHQNRANAWRENRPSSTVTFAYTSNDFRKNLISENNVELEGIRKMNENGKNDEKCFPRRTQRTAWNSSNHNKSSDLISLANCVDISEVKEKVSKSCCADLRAPPATPDFDQIQLRQAVASESQFSQSYTYSVRTDHKEEEKSKQNYPDTDRNSYTDNITNAVDLDILRSGDLSQYLNSGNKFHGSNIENSDHAEKLVSQLQAFGFHKACIAPTRKTSRIEEVWGSRNRNNISTSKNLIVSHHLVSSVNWDKIGNKI